MGIVSSAFVPELLPSPSSRNGTVLLFTLPPQLEQVAFRIEFVRSSSRYKQSSFSSKLSRINSCCLSSSCRNLFCAQSNGDDLTIWQKHHPNRVLPDMRKPLVAWHLPYTVQTSATPSPIFYLFVYHHPRNNINHAILDYHRLTFDSPPSIASIHWEVSKRQMKNIFVKN